MNRILFKGKRCDNGEWVQSGCILRLSNGGEREFYLADIKDEMEVYFGGVTGNILSIPECNFYKVKPETVCRSCGQTDKNGKPLFENDIVKVNGMATARIVWQEYISMFTLYFPETKRESNFEIFDGSDCEWIGNDTEKPEGWDKA